MIHQPPTKFPLAKQAEVNEMLNWYEVEEDSACSRLLLIILIKKKNGTWIFAWAQEAEGLLPTALDWWHPAGAKLFFTLDLKSGYWQVHLQLDNKEKMAFSKRQELWQFMVIPRGLCKASAAFVWLMETVLRGLTYESFLVHKDNVPVIRCMFK
jgi:hypothetical protein